MIQSRRDIKCRYIYQQAAAGLASQVRTKTGEPLSGGPPLWTPVFAEAVKTTRNSISISISSNFASSDIPPRPTTPTSLSLRLPNSSSQELRRWGCCREQDCRHLELHSSLPALALEGDIIPQGAGPPAPPLPPQSDPSGATVRSSSSSSTSGAEARVIVSAKVPTAGTGIA